LSTLTLTTPAAALALDWEVEVKGHLRVDTADERTRVETVLIPAATQIAEGETERQLITATWTLYLDGFPTSGTKIELPKPPLQSVSSIKYYDTQGVLQTWAASNYSVVAPAGPRAPNGYIVPGYGITYPSTYGQPNDVVIEFVCGYGAAYGSVPAQIRAAMLLLVGEMFERREDAIAGTIIGEVPLAAHRLLWPFRVW
jgi:uncharacterized phiE125 gp8 family phage protein